jgi:hypothetical protein
VTSLDRAVCVLDSDLARLPDTCAGDTGGEDGGFVVEAGG